GQVRVRMGAGRHREERDDTERGNDHFFTGRLASDVFTGCGASPPPAGAAVLDSLALLAPAAGASGSRGSVAAVDRVSTPVFAYVRSFSRVSVMSRFRIVS